MSTTEQLEKEIKLQIGWDEDGNECWFVPLAQYNMVKAKLAEAQYTLRQQILKIEQCERELQWAERELTWMLEGIKAEDVVNV